MVGGVDVDVKAEDPSWHDFYRGTRDQLRPRKQIPRKSNVTARHAIVSVREQAIVFAKSALSTTESSRFRKGPPRACSPGHCKLLERSTVLQPLEIWSIFAEWLSAPIRAVWLQVLVH